MERPNVEWYPVATLPPEIEGDDASEDVLGCYLSGQMSVVYFDYIAQQWTDVETSQFLGGKALMAWTHLPAIPSSVVRARLLIDPRD